MQIVWAKAGRGIWGLAHVFEGELYITKDIVDDSLSQGIGTAPKPAPKGKHVQLFKMRRKVAKCFYSTAADAPNGQ